MHLRSFHRLLLGFTLAAALSGCVVTSPIANRQQTFTRPVVIAVVGTTARIQLMQGGGLSGPAYWTEVPEWRINQTVEAAAVQRLRARGIQAQAGGDALRAKVLAIAGYKPGNALDLRGINDTKLDDAVKQLGITGADSVLFLTGGAQPLPVGAIRVLSEYGLCQTTAGAINTTYVFASVRGHAFSNPGGQRLGAALQKNGGLRTLPIAEMPFIRPWDQMPAAQKARLKHEVEACALGSLNDVIVGLGL
jgi:hypothetical protein